MKGAEGGGRPTCETPGLGASRTMPPVPQGLRSRGESGGAGLGQLASSGAGEGRHLAGCWGIRPQARLQGAWRMMAHDKAPGGYRCEWLVLHWRKLPVASRSALSSQVPKCSPASGR